MLRRAVPAACACASDRGTQRLADLVAYDASLGDSDNTVGHWDFLSIRGVVLDKRSNFRRDDLPIRAETSIPLDNKARVEIFKGLSGQQVGWAGQRGA